MPFTSTNQTSYKYTPTTVNRLNASKTSFPPITQKKR